MKIGIIVAMEMEYDAMLSLLGGKPEGRIGCHQVILRRSGIAKVNAAVHCVDLINEHHPDCIISTGAAGGAGNGVRKLDAVAARELVYHDVWCGTGNQVGQVQGLPARFRTNDTLYECAMSLPDNVHGGLICTGDIFAGHDDILGILEKFPECLAVDMESAALAQTCLLKNVPFISFRIISDTLEGGDNENEYMDFWQEVGYHSFNLLNNFINSLPESL